MIKRVTGKIQADYHSAGYAEARQVAAPLIHWIPESTGIDTSVVMPDASVLSGRAEDSCRQLLPNMIVQFERFGFVRVDNITAEELLVYYTHR
jgi:glutamyl-tRNA synthetase